MNLISIDKITKYQGEKKLFEDISFGISSGEKTAIIGVNGSGKSTLLKILSNDIEADSGIISYNNELKIGYLPQIPKFNPEITIIDYLFDKKNPKANLLKRYDQILTKFQNDGDLESQNRLNEIMEEMEIAQVWDFESEIKEITTILGIKDRLMKMGTLSGGMVKKVSLAKVLLQETNLLMLDEPTNHLDIETIIWLQNYLQKTDKSIIMVTHDRYLLDNVCNSIFEIDQKTIFSYKGNYGYFLKKKQEREHSIKRDYERVKTILKDELEWLSRSPSARTGKSKNRKDKINNMLSIEKPEVIEDINLSVKGRRVGKKVAIIKNISKSFGDKLIIKNFNYKFKKGDKIGIVGSNGTGKSTLLNILTSKISPSSGDIEIGINTHFGYFDQHSKELDGELILIKYIREAAEFIELEDGIILSATKMLERFLFPPELHYTKIKNLSGGEKRRLYLLYILMKNPNFLILDEPTNDLDIKTLSILEDFLKSFPGILLIVSHDRYFMDRVVEHLLIFEGDGIIKGFSGSCSEYYDYKKEKLLQKKQIEKKDTSFIKKPKKKVKLSYKEKLEFETIEDEIENLENEKNYIEKIFENGGKQGEDISKLAKRYEEIKNEIDNKMERWEYLASFDF